MNISFLDLCLCLLPSNENLGVKNYFFLIWSKLTLIISQLKRKQILGTAKISILSKITKLLSWHSDILFCTVKSTSHQRLSTSYHDFKIQKFMSFRHSYTVLTFKSTLNIKREEFKFTKITTTKSQKETKSYWGQRNGISIFQILIVYFT